MKNQPTPSLPDAIAEAQRRWHAMGGWAELSGPYQKHDARSNTYGELYYECRVGIREHDTHGTRKIMLGKARTFAEAFAMADRRNERELQPKPPRKRKPPHPKALPQRELPW